MRTLITGVTGFAGGYLAEALVERDGGELFGLARRGDWPSGLAHLARTVELHACDLTDGDAARQVILRVRPDRVYHLAGYARAGQSFREVDQAWAGNLTATRNLYRAIEERGGNTRVLFVGSGLVYEDPEAPDHAHDEQCPLLPASPYAASKAAADLLSYQVFRSSGLEVIRARPFNHIGPQQSAEFAVAHFARQIVAIEQGSQPPVLRVGNLSPLRDLTDVRDMVQAYIALLDRGQPGEAYNVASGQATSIEAVLNELLRLSGAAVEVVREPKLVRDTEVAVVRGNVDKLRRETGWEPRITLQNTLSDTLNYSRGQS